MIGAPIVPNGCKSSADGTYSCGGASPVEMFTQFGGPAMVAPPKPTLSVPEMFAVSGNNTSTPPVPVLDEKRSREYASFNYTYT